MAFFARANEEEESEKSELSLNEGEEIVKEKLTQSLKQSQSMGGPSKDSEIDSEEEKDIVVENFGMRPKRNISK